MGHLPHAPDVRLAGKLLLNIAEKYDQRRWTDLDDQHPPGHQIPQRRSARSGRRGFLASANRLQVLNQSVVAACSENDAPITASDGYTVISRALETECHSKFHIAETQIHRIPSSTSSAAWVSTGADRLRTARILQVGHQDEHGIRRELATSDHYVQADWAHYRQDAKPLLERAGARVIRELDAAAKNELLRNAQRWL
jgi:hypothetical protein